MNLYLRLALLCVLAHLAAACAITHSVNQNVLPKATAEAMVSRWPLAVGLYVPEAVRTKTFSQQAWHLPAGESIVSVFHWALSSMFDRVVPLEASPAGRIMPAGLAGAIELAGVEYAYGLQGALLYEVHLYSGQGDRVDTWTVTTSLPLWDSEASSLSGSIQTVGTEMAYAIRDVTAQFMVHFADRPPVQEWLQTHGAAAIVRPDFPAGAVPERAVSRILLVPNIQTWRYTDAGRGMNCVGDRLAQASPPYAVIPVDKVRLDYFPWLEPSTAPKTQEQVKRWFAHPGIQARTRALGVQYLLEFHGETKTEVPGGGVLCGAGYGGGGYLGFAWGSRESSFSATLLDIWRGVSLDSTAIQRSRVYMPALGFPITIMAPTESMACEQLARQVQALLTQGGQ